MPTGKLEADCLDAPACALLPRAAGNCMGMACSHRLALPMSLTTLAVREAVLADAPALAELKLATFRETFLEGFGVPYPPHDLAIFEAESYSVAKVRAELAEPSHRTWVVDAGAAEAEAGRRLVAYAHVGPCKLPHPDVQPGEMELYQIYLRREVQGAGLGKALMDRAMGFLEGSGQEPGQARIWLGVWSGNLSAQGFYRKLGFTVVGEYQFPVGEWRDDELILRRDPV